MGDAGMMTARHTRGRRSFVAMRTDKDVDRLFAVSQLASTVLVGVVAGIFVATQLGQVRVQRTLAARDFTLVKHSFEIALGRIMPALVVAAGFSLVVALALAITATDLVVLLLTMAALALWIAVVIVTLVFNAPVNAQAARWHPDSPPTDWEALRARWHLGQTIRTPLAVASFVCVATGAQWPQIAA
jgi:uncharacterized membrane protein